MLLRKIKEMALSYYVTIIIQSCYKLIINGSYVNTTAILISIIS